MLAGLPVPAAAQIGQPAVPSEGERALDAIPAAQRSRLLAEGVLLLEAARRPNMTLGALLIVERPARETFERLARPAEQRCYLPEVKRSTSIRRVEGEELVEFEVDKVFNVRFRVMHHFWPDRLAIDWALDPSFDNGLRDLRGYFQVTAIAPGRALVEYGTAVDTSRLVPNFLQRRFMRRDVPVALHRLRDYIQGGATCR